MLLHDFDNLVEKYLEYLQTIRGCSSHTIMAYQSALGEVKNHYTIEQDEAKERFDIRSFRLQIATLHPKTIALKLTAVRGFIKFLNTHHGYDFQLVGDNAIKTPKTLPKPINTSYIDEVLSIASLQEKTLILLMYGVGLRISEVASIELNNITNEWLLVRGKGNKERQLPLLPIIEQTIQAYITFAKPKVYLFEKKGEAMNTHQIRYIVTQLFKSIGIKVTPHQLRHTFATELLNDDARLSDISKLLGHATMASTQVYTQLASSKKLQDYLTSHPLCKQKI
ncbi:MAG: tyrosine-type recombinase/integrase [Campylobacterales bacterium]|nr:tyrosine-type recombinase/integrase [Campylobacterales bacterium]